LFSVLKNAPTFLLFIWSS